MDYRRFFASLISQDTVMLEGDELRHCVQVTRHKVGFDFIATTGDGYDYLCRITEINKQELLAKIINKTPNNCEPKQQVVLYQAVCKELDFIVQKAVELGATQIVPFFSHNTNVNNFKLDRFKKIVVDASKQCGRGVLPIITEPVDFKQAIAMSADSQNRVICYEKCTDDKFCNIQQGGNLALYIGSEGGFTTQEIDFAVQSGVTVTTLGKRILRAETASIVALTKCMGALGEM